MGKMTKPELYRAYESLSGTETRSTMDYFIQKMLTDANESAERMPDPHTAKVMLSMAARRLQTLADAW